MLAMEKLGFECDSRGWDSDNITEEEFKQHVLPYIKESIAVDGPMYVSFNPGVFGDMGHGCVIIGYDDRKEELYFHNPWGNKFEKEYKDVAIEASGIVRIFAPKQVKSADAAFMANVISNITVFPESLEALESLLDAASIAYNTKMCNRRDETEDRRFAAQTAKKEGRKILDIALMRNPAIIIPRCDRKGKIEGYYYAIVSKETPSKFDVRELTQDGWQPEETLNLGNLLRNWTTLVQEKDIFQPDIWELPMNLKR